MNNIKLNSQKKSYIALLIGTFLYAFMAWRWHMPLANWFGLIFLVFFFRNQKSLLSVIIGLLALSLASFLKMNNGWDMPLYLAISVSILIPTVLVFIPLVADKYLLKKLHSGLRTLIFPTVIVIIEFLIGLTPLGSVFSLGASQVEHTAFLQFSSIAGMWGLSFLIAWTAPVLNTLYEENFSIKIPSNLSKIYGCVIIFAVFFGAMRLAIIDPNSPTVKVASISVTHERDYWGIVDEKTPIDSKNIYSEELLDMENELFNLSQKAADGGAKIIFWSEGNSVFYEDDEMSFLNRAKTFAQENQIYFVPAVLKLYYNSYVSDNMLYMITPEGEISFDYVKTISWYETTSDGIIDYVDTPYGRIAATICFDNDFPHFIRQAGRNNVDILIVPAFDTPVIKEYHGQTALVRGVENGMSVVRQSNKGCSYAVDYLGNIIAYQDYFDTSERLMYSDVPTEGTTTIYSRLGDWVIYAVILNLVFYAALLILIKIKKIPSNLESKLFSC